MNVKVGGSRPVSTTTTDLNANNTNMVSDLTSPEDHGPYTPRSSRTPRKAATFGKRSNSMRRNPKAEVAKQGWLYKQASSGVKQWNKRWFVLTDRCLFYYKDEKEDTVLGSLPLLSFQVRAVQPSDNVTRKFAFKAEHAGTRTYYFGAESHQEQEEWIHVMSGATQFYVQRTNCENAAPAPVEANHTMVTKAPDSSTHPPSQQHPPTQTTRSHDDDDAPDGGDHHQRPELVNGVDSAETPSPSTPVDSDDLTNVNANSQEARRMSEERRGGGGGGERGGGGGERDRVGSSPGSHGGYHHHAPQQPNNQQQPNGWGPYGPPPHHHAAGNPPTPRGHSNGRPPPGVHPDGGGMLREAARDQPPENVVLRRGFVPRTAPERQAQRKSSMTQLQQWVNQRRPVIPTHEDMNSPSRYYTVNRGVSADFYGAYHPGGPQYVDEYPLYPPGVRPDSICSVSAVGGGGGGYDRRRSLRDGPPPHYGPPMQRDPWGPPHQQQYYGGGPGGVDMAQASMRRLSIQPRSRSVPRSPSSSSGGPYSPGLHSFVSPARSPSMRFPGRMREDVIYADPSIYGMRRSISSPKYDYPGDRRSLSQGLYHYPASPSIHSKMEDMLDLQLQRNLEYLDQQVPPFHDVYNRELHPTLKLNEIETSKILGRLCEQNRIVKDQEAVVHRLRMDKDSLEGALVATHQEMELYHNQPLAMDKLQLKKETLQNQLINIRGELSQASSALTTSRMEFEALEDEANAIHGDLWEQLNAGGQSELVHRHIQKEFWRVQDVLEGLHKSNSSRGTDTAKHRVVGGAPGSFSTNSPASPLSSVSLTSPLSPYSPMPATQPSPTKQLGPEVSTGRTQPGFDPSASLEPCASSTPADFSTSAESRRRPTPRARPKSWSWTGFETSPKPDRVRLRPRPSSYREPDHTTSHTNETNDHQTFPLDPHTFSWPTNTFQVPTFQLLRDSLLKLEPVEEEEDYNPNISPTFDLCLNPVSQNRAARQTRQRQGSPHDYKSYHQNSYTYQTHAAGQALGRATSNAPVRHAMVGYRKDVYPDPRHAPPAPFGHQNGRGYPFYGNGHCSSVSKAQRRLFQDTYEASSLLSINDFPHLYTSTPENTHVRAATTEYHPRQFPPQARVSRVCARIRPLSYPNVQFVCNDCPVPQSISPCMASGRTMQSHF